MEVKFKASLVEMGEKTYIRIAVRIDDYHWTDAVTLAIDDTMTLPIEGVHIENVIVEPITISVHYIEDKNWDATNK